MEYLPDIVGAIVPLQAASSAAAAAQSAQEAASAVTGVVSFNGRQGAVMPQADDYTAEMVGALESGGTAVAAQKLETPVNIGDASFDGSASVTLEDMGAMADDTIVPITQGGTGETTGMAALNALGVYFASKIFNTDSSGKFSMTGLFPGSVNPIYAVVTVGGGGNGWVKLDDPAANKISGTVYRPDGSALTSAVVRINMVYGTVWPSPA